MSAPVSVTSPSGLPVVSRLVRRVGVAWLAVLASVSAYAQSVYTCTDARGRKLTSDRPIPECTDREQKVLGPTGTVKGTVAPTLTARERADEEEKAKALQEDQARVTEEKRRNRALLMRYPKQAAHDRERAESLAQVGTVRHSAETRLAELRRDKARLDTEMEFYRQDPKKAPPLLRRQVDEVNQSIAAQQRFIADQDAEATRINQRFDEELVRLKRLWAQQSASVAGSAPSAPARQH